MVYMKFASSATPLFRSPTACHTQLETTVLWSAREKLPATENPHHALSSLHGICGSNTFQEMVDPRRSRAQSSSSMRMIPAHDNAIAQRVVSYCRRYWTTLSFNLPSWRGKWHGIKIVSLTALEVRVIKMS